jgi:superfamily II DNA helicase RecQ
MYVLPALLKKQYSFVVSPLRALMADQIRNLKEIGVQAISLGPGISPEEKKGIMSNISQIMKYIKNCQYILQ